MKWMCTDHHYWLDSLRKSRTSGVRCKRIFCCNTMPLVENTISASTVVRETHYYSQRYTGAAWTGYGRVILKHFNILCFWYFVHFWLIHMHTPFCKWDFMIAIVLLSACVCAHIHYIHCLICPVLCSPHFHSVHVFVPPCIRVEHSKQAHHWWVRGHGGGGRRQKVGQGRGNGEMWIQS